MIVPETARVKRALLFGKNSHDWRKLDTLEKLAQGSRRFMRIVTPLGISGYRVVIDIFSVITINVGMRDFGNRDICESEL